MTPMTDALWRQRYHLLFGIRRSILYHQRRQRFFDALHMTQSAITLIFGSATFFALFGGNQATTNWERQGLMIAALIVTVFSVMNLVVGFTRKSCLHNVLASKFMELEKRFISFPEGDFTEEHLRQFTAARLDIEIGEPPKKIALDSVCHNELLKAEGILDPKQRVKMTRFQRAMAQFFTYNEDKIDKPA